MSKQYRVAVIGSTGRGNYGHGLDTAWRAVPETKVVAIADDNPDGLAAAAKRLKLTKAFGDYRKMLDEVKADIVAICPRWIDQHRDMALVAASHGCHIYMEKPFCRSMADADEVVKACETNRVKFALAHPTRYSPKIKTIRALIEEGRLGRILEFRARGKEDRRGGGEDLWVLGTHVMDMIHAIGGPAKWCFAEVTQEGKPITKENVVEGSEGIGPLAGDMVRATFGMRDGATAYFHSVRNAGGSPSRYGLQIFGSKGILELLEGTLPSVKYLPDPNWSPGRSGATWQDVSSVGIGKQEPLTDPKYRARHTLAIYDLLDAIETNRQPLSSVYEARSVTEMIVAVFESQRRKRLVELPLKNRANPLSLL